MPYCVAYKCNNTSVNAPGLSFHKFPAISDRPDIRRQWIHNVSRDKWTPSKYSKLCSEHFTPGCFEEDKYQKYLGDTWGKSARKLKKDAVPTIFPQRERKQGQGRPLTLRRQMLRERQEVTMFYV